MPQDRIATQPAKGFCRNPACRERSDQEFTFRVEHDRFACPKCGANAAPMVGVLTLTHLLIPEKGGPVIGTGGLQYRIGCDAKRAYLATWTNDEAVTDNPHIANCEGCLKEAERLNIKRETGWVLSKPAE